jgi:hypothetical protein
MPWLAERLSRRGLQMSARERAEAELRLQQEAGVSPAEVQLRGHHVVTHHPAMLDYEITMDDSRLPVIMAARSPSYIGGAAALGERRDGRPADGASPQSPPHRLPTWNTEPTISPRHVMLLPPPPARSHLVFPSKLTPEPTTNDPRQAVTARLEEAKRGEQAWRTRALQVPHGARRACIVHHTGRRVVNAA